MRCQLSSIVLSSAAPSGPLSRYFMSQICCEIEATLGMMVVLLVERHTLQPKRAAIKDARSRFVSTALSRAAPAIRRFNG
jgi:hypothetical protein